MLSLLRLHASYTLHPAEVLRTSSAASIQVVLLVLLLLPPPQVAHH
jgi:hypothetical protein